MDNTAHASPETHNSREGRRSAPSPSREKLEETLALGQQGLLWLGQLGDLFRLEAMLAAQSLSKVFKLWILMLPIVLLTWVSFAVTLSWAVYAWLGSPLTALASFFLLNLLLLGCMYGLFQRQKYYMGFHETRNQLRKTLGDIRDEINKTDSAKSPTDSADA